MIDSFSHHIPNYSFDEINHQISQKTAIDVERALASLNVSFQDFLALISPAATPYLELMAIRSQELTLKRFGKTIQLYVPFYFSNACTNHCVYCGFNHNNKIQRIILSPEQIEAELRAIKDLGDFEHILLVTGESPKQVGVEYLKMAIELAHKHFASVSLEVQPLDEAEYSTLMEAGLNSVYVYQETYNQNRYSIYHPAGKKRYFNYRLDTPDRLGRAGVRRIGLGILIGLEDWRTDSALLALHLAYLRKHYWRTRYSISFPRMRPYQGDGFKPNVIMSDKELAQTIFAFRIFDNDVELALSTRESVEFRNNMMTLGVTNYSAGSRTEPGGYATYPQSLEQFSVNDNRSPIEVMESIKERGYEVVWKDWDKIF